MCINLHKLLLKGEKNEEKFLISLMISILITGILCIINFVGAYAYQDVPLALEISGGECTEYIGFGVYMLKIFPMTRMDDTTYAISTKSNVQVGFEPKSFFVSVIIIFIIVFLIAVCFKKEKTNGERET